MNVNVHQRYIDHKVEISDSGPFWCRQWVGACKTDIPQILVEPYCAYGTVANATCQSVHLLAVGPRPYLPPSFPCVNSAGKHKGPLVFSCGQETICR